MIIVWIVCAFLMASLAAGFYYRRAEKYALDAVEVWRRLNRDVTELVSDAAVPSVVALHVTAFAVIAGCGCFTRAFLVEVFKRRIGLASTKSAIPKELNHLSAKQKLLLSKIMRDVLLYDSLRAPFAGFVARRVFLRFDSNYQKNRMMKWSKVQFLVSAADEVAHKPRNVSQVPMLQPA